MTSMKRIREIADYAKSHGDREAILEYRITQASLDRIKRYAKTEQMPPKLDDKKVPEFEWREWLEHLEARQVLAEKASGTQDHARIKIRTDAPYIVFKPVSDMHLGSVGVNLSRFKNMTDAILDIPELYFALLGDECDNFVSFKNQLPMLTQVLSPAEQDAFLESWLEEVQEKLLFATWGNHGAFEEKVSGRNSVKKILSKNTVFFGGIGVCDLELNDQTYRIAATHTTRFSSSMNKTHGLKQLARRDIPDADLYLAGHIHDPAYEVSYERGRDQIFMVLGSLKEDDPHAKQYYTPFSSGKDGAVVFSTSEHRAIPFPSVEDALEFIGR